MSLEFPYKRSAKLGKHNERVANTQSTAVNQSDRPSPGTALQACQLSPFSSFPHHGAVFRTKVPVQRREHERLAIDTAVLLAMFCLPFEPFTQPQLACPALTVNMATSGVY